MNFINNSILPTQENVNSDTQKYSMQNSDNYTWQEIISYQSLKENYNIIHIKIK